MYQQEKETRLDIDDVRNALEAYKANIVTPLDRVNSESIKRAYRVQRYRTNTAGNKRHGQDVFRKVSTG